jgi:sugar phosphate isomerase/epimerase
MDLARLPLTYFFEWNAVDEKARRMVMAEFAANGAKHLVLTHTLLKMLCGTPALYRKLAEEVAEAGLDLVDAHAPFRDECDLWLPVEAYRRQMIARRKFELQLASDFGVKTCTIHVGNWPYPGHTLEQYRDAVRRSLEELLPVAEKLGVTIALENLYKPLNLPDDLVGFVEEFRSDRLGLCFDAGHANILARGGEYPDGTAYSSCASMGTVPVWDARALDKMLPYVVSCHLHDNRIRRDDHDLPGTGTVDWQTVLEKLSRAPNLKCIQSEVEPVRNRIPVRDLCAAFRKLLAHPAERLG